MTTINTGPATMQEIAYMNSLNEQLQKNPNDFDSLMKKGILSFAVFLRIDEALEILKLVVERNPKNIDAYFWLGECLCFCTGDVVEAEKVMRAALALDPNRADCHMILATCLNDENELLHYEKAIELEPTWILPRKYLANNLFLKGELELARQELKKTLLIIPDPQTLKKVEDPIGRYYEACITGRHDPDAKQRILDFIEEIDAAIAEKNDPTN